MDLNKINVELRRLSELTADWQLRGGADELERELALGMLRRVYEAIRFPETVPVRSGEAEHPVEVPVMLDLDGILEPDASVSPGVGVAAEPEEPVASAADPARAGVSAADPESGIGSEETPADLPERVGAEAETLGIDGEDIRPAADAEAGAESTVPESADSPLSVSVSTVETSPETEGTAAPEPIKVEPAQTSTEEPARSSDEVSPEKFPVIEPALFGLDEIVQHKRKQRVIMSLYDDDPDALRRTSRPQRPQVAAEPQSEEEPIPEISVEKLTDTVVSVGADAEGSERSGSVEPQPVGMQVPEEAHAAISDEPVAAASRDAVGPASVEAGPQASGAVLGEVINRNVQTLAETFAPLRDAVADVAHRAPVADLRAAIGINDKFLLIRDLFDGDAAACDRAIETLNAFDELDECMIYIAEHYAWNPNSDGAKLLMDLLERKLA